MKFLPRFLAAVSGLAVLTLVASACDTSPYAASVNSHVIKETALNSELRAWAGNNQYVHAFDSAEASSGVSVVGDAPGTYNKAWVANILDNMIVSRLVHQRLQQLGRSPSEETYQSSRVVSEISQIGWSSFTPAFRDTLVTRLAELATLSPVTVDDATLQSAYRQYRSYFFSQVCLIQAATFSLADAQRLSRGRELLGGRVCYGQAQLEDQPAGFRQVVQDLPVSGISQPIKTRYGYQVVRLVSRDVIPLDQQVRQVLSVAITDARGVANPSVQPLIDHARVQVNPNFGSWTNRQVAPPKLPGSST